MSLALLVAVVAGCGDDAATADADASATATATASSTGDADPTTGPTPTGGVTTGGSSDEGSGSGDATTGSATTGTTSDETSSGTTGEPSTGDGSSGDASTGGAVCGDGVVDRGEVCDDGNPDDGDACTNACQAAVCGDEIVGPGELCDDGDDDDADECTNACTTASCGDGVVQRGLEQCDDGDADDGDACLSTCLLATCGDGAIQVGVEACDDGNAIDGDECTAACTVAACGDGVVQDGVEACDDGNAIDGDACTADCAVAACGDGIVQVGVEACDEGSNNADDGACTLGCAAAACGDGLVHAGVEACDDGDAVDGDGCEADCAATLVFVDAGGEHTCARSVDGGVRCWGWGDAGRLGHANTKTIGDDETPASAGDVPLGAAALQLSAGDQHVCAVLAGGGVRCWGDGGSGRLGYANTSDIGDTETPASVGLVNVGATVAAVTAGDLHTCALTTGGKVRCWGAGSAGRLGYGNTNNIGDTEAPATAGDVNVGATALDVVAGDDHTCARITGGKVRCWGRGSDGQLGYGNTNTIGDNEKPATAGDVNVGGAVVQITAGQTHTCALLEGGKVRCWGASASGELGYGNTKTIGDNESPASAGDVAVGGVVVQIAAGWHHTCALLQGGAVRCWGAGGEGRLGYGDADAVGDDETPASAGDVAIGGPALAVTAGRHHSCAILAGGTLRCWGSGTYGKLGYANTATIGDDEAPASAGPVAVY